jgi:hypothetical protein
MMSDRASSTWIVVVRSFGTILKKASENEVETYVSGNGREVFGFDPRMRDYRVL